MHACMHAQQSAKIDSNKDFCHSKFRRGDTYLVIFKIIFSNLTKKEKEKEKTFLNILKPKVLFLLNLTTKNVFFFSYIKSNMLKIKWMLYIIVMHILKPKVLIFLYILGWIKIITIQHKYIYIYSVTIYTSTHYLIFK